MTVVAKVKHPSNSNAQWVCRCSCGRRKHVIVATGDLKNGRTRSCGCLRRELRTTHGAARTPEHVAWLHMWARCRAKPGTSQHRLYVQAGVTVTPAWHKFEIFIKDVGPRPSSKHSLDRWPNPHGNYTPKNVRWATPRQQANNKRNTLWLTIDGVKRTISDWARRSGVNYVTLKCRLRRGMSPSDAVFGVVRPNKVKLLLNDLVSLIKTMPRVYKKLRGEARFQRARRLVSK